MCHSEIGDSQLQKALQLKVLYILLRHILQCQKIGGYQIDGRRFRMVTTNAAMAMQGIEPSSMIKCADLRQRLNQPYTKSSAKVIMDTSLTQV